MKQYLILLFVMILATVTGYRYYKQALMQKEFVVMQEILQGVNESVVEDIFGLEEDLEQYV